MPNGGGLLPSYMQVPPPPGPAGKAGGSRSGKVPLPAFGPQVRHHTSSAPTHLLRCHRLSLATRTSASQQVRFFCRVEFVCSNQAVFHDHRSHQSFSSLC